MNTLISRLPIKRSQKLNMMNGSAKCLLRLIGLISPSTRLEIIHLAPKNWPVFQDIVKQSKLEPVVKVCKKCGETKQLSSFHKHRGCKYGYNTVCKECRKPISQREWSIKPYQQKILSRAKSRAAKRGLEFNLTIEDIIIPAICPVFKKPIVVPSIDRIDSSKGYVRGNIVTGKQIGRAHV